MTGDNNYTAIGERIDSLVPVRQRGKFAAQLGISKQTLQNYVEGKRAPQVETLIRLQQLTGVSIDWLLTGAGGLEIGEAAIGESDKLELEKDVGEIIDRVPHASSAELGILIVRQFLAKLEIFRMQSITKGDEAHKLKQGA